MTPCLLVISGVSEEICLSILRIVFSDYGRSTRRTNLLGRHSNGHDLHVLLKRERVEEPSSIVILLD